MTITYQILINVVVYAVTVAVLYAGVKHRLDRLEEKTMQDHGLLYQRGSLNVIDQKTCKENRDIIFSAIRRSEKATEMMLVELREIKEALIELKVKLELMNGKKEQS